MDSQKNNVQNKKRHAWVPLLVTLSIIAGIFMGIYISSYTGSSQILPGFKGNNKIDQVFGIINSDYVDTIKVDDLIEKTIPAIFKELDPHSVYIPAADLQSVNEELEGSFSGIGIQFNIITDTITVVGVISGGPSEKMGILPGDRIVTIDDSLFIATTNEKVLKSLRGPKGSKVNIGIARMGTEELIPFDITRDDIPVYSVDASFVTNGIGYIKVSKFGRTTHSEFITAIARLKIQGAEGFVVDLRSNSGGYMDAAINMVNEFLGDREMIVYAEGKNYPRYNFHSNGTGVVPQDGLVVLMDEWSASASEIFAGAIQDNDRGSIVGRRSFGKGLVQNQIDLADGSAVRLTIARYYTPSGRSIQKGYELGKGDDYEMDIQHRYEHGEFENRDSIKLDESKVFYTKGGREVFGGGGIMPDYFVPFDTTGVTSYYTSLRNRGIIYEYTFQFVDKNREKLKEYKTPEALTAYLNTLPLVDEVADFAVQKGIKKRVTLLAISQQLIRGQINAYIVRNALDENAFYKVLYENDPALNKAIKLIKNGESKPGIEP